MFEPNSIRAQGAGVDLHLSEWSAAEIGLRGREVTGKDIDPAATWA